MIGDEEKHPFRLVYADQGILYIAEGYGEQPTTGYSVEVRELYETEEEIRVRTSLLDRKKVRRSGISLHIPAWLSSLNILKKMFYLIEEEKNGTDQKTDSLYAGGKEYL